MGNGYPAAAFGGRDEVMSVLPDHVSHGGTYAGNRVAAAAAVKTLSIIKDTDALEKIHALGRRIQGGLAEVLNETGLPYTFTGHPSMFGIMFAEKVATEYRDWANSDHDLYDAIAIEMAVRGAMPEPDSREPWFLCEAHTSGDYADRIVSIVQRCAGRGPRGPRAGRRPRRRARVRSRTRRPASGRTEEGVRSMVLDGNAVRSVDRAAALLLASGTPRARPGSPSWRGASGCTSPRRPACWRRSRSAASSSRTRRPASTGSASSSSGSRSAPSGRSTCAGSRCRSWSAWRG